MNINEIEKYFNSIKLPNENIKLNDHSVIIDIKKFIETNISIYKNTKSNKISEPYLHRLIKLKQILDEKYINNNTTNNTTVL